MSSSFVPVLICTQCRSVLAHWGLRTVRGKVDANTLEHLRKLHRNDDYGFALSLEAMTPKRSEACWALPDGRWWLDPDSKSTPLRSIESTLVVCSKCGATPVRVLRATGKRRSWSWFNPLTWVVGPNSWQLATSEAEPGAVSVADKEGA